MIATVAGAFVGVWGAISLANDFLPAHRGWVRQETQFVSDKFNLTIDKLTSELKVLQKQQVDASREILRKEQFELDIKFREESNPVYKALIRQRMNQIEDALEKTK
jgi:hypothetical protein